MEDLRVRLNFLALNKIISDADFLVDVKIDKYLVPKDGKLIGNAMKAKLSATIINENGKFNDILNNFCELEYFFPDNPGWVNQGLFKIVKIEDIKTSIELKVEGFDLMQLFEKRIDTDFQYPTTLRKMIDQICSENSVFFSTNHFPNQDVIINDPISFENDSLRDVIGYIAECSGRNAFFKNDNLVFEFFENVSQNPILITDFFEDIQEKATDPINMIVIGKGDLNSNIYYPSTLPDIKHEYRIDNNPILNDYREELIKAIFEELNGFSYVPFKLELPGNSKILPGAKINYIDIFNNKIETVVFNVEWDYNGGSTSILSTDRMGAKKTDYSYAGTIDKRVTVTEIKVDKVNNEITSIVSETAELGEQLSELKQTVDGFDFTIKESGNLNLIENSVGWNGLKFWRTTGEVKVDQSIFVRDISSSKSSFALGKATMNQSFSVKPGIQYSVSIKIYNKAPDIFKFEIINGDEMVKVFETSKNENWVVYEKTLVAKRSEMEVFFTSVGAFCQFTDLIIVEGELPQLWYPAENEVLSENVKIDRQGITVSNSKSDTKTVINESEFAVYSNQIKAISVNKDETTLQKTIINERLVVGKLRFDVKADGVDLTLIN